jgi:hypothetical protein
MNSVSAAILASPHPCGHIIYPYTDENLVGQAVCLFASAGIRGGEGVILIMTGGHSKSFKLRLHAEGFDVEGYERAGQLTCITTEDLMARFILGGELDESLFRAEVGSLIARARTSARNGCRPDTVRIFGEMVSQLRTTNPDATKRLEELWNEVVQDYSVSLLCTYALHHAEDQIPEPLMDLHSHRIERQPVGSGARRA